MTTAKRITEAREAAGLSKSELARAIGVSPATITQWESGETKKYDADNIRKAARAVKRSVSYLLTGRESPKVFISHGSNVGPGPEQVYSYPLISDVQAGSWDPAESPFRESEIAMIGCHRRLSPGSYALRVDGPSMTAPSGDHSYPDGTIVFVDPEKRSPHSGQHVIAKLVGDDKVIFKVFRQEGSRVWLQPLNPSWPLITDEFRILGTVITSIKDAP